MSRKGRFGHRPGLSLFLIFFGGTLICLPFVSSAMGRSILRNAQLGRKDNSNGPIR
jgi:hypothetical protein